MRKNEVLQQVIFAIICSIVGGTIFGKAVGAGIILGTIFSLIHYTVLQSFFTSILAVRQFNVGRFVLYFLGNFGIFAIPLYIGCVYPDLVNVFGAAFGLTTHNIYIYVSTLMQSYFNRKER